MNCVLALWILLSPVFAGDACDGKGLLVAREIDISNDSMKNVIIVGDKVYTATLIPGATTSAFKSLLPLTMDMTELNGNEKYFQLSKDLPVDTTKPGTIEAGDLMLWGSNTLVVFYKTFATTYSYTRLGRIDNPTGLAQALGKGNVQVTIE